MERPLITSFRKVYISGLLSQCLFYYLRIMDLGEEHVLYVRCTDAICAHACSVAVTHQ